MKYTKMLQTSSGSEGGETKRTIVSVDQVRRKPLVPPRRALEGFMLHTTVVGGTANNSCKKGPCLQQLKTATDSEAMSAGRHTYYSAPRRASSSLIRDTSTDYWGINKGARAIEGLRTRSVLYPDLSVPF